MKLIHLGDLHLGKKVYGKMMLEEQKDALQQVLALACREHCTGVLIAGDVYDTSMPVQEAVSVLDWFLSELAGAGIPVYMIAGNHDSGIRLGFAGSVLERGGVHIAGTYQGRVPFFDLEDGEVKVRIHLLPFVRPGSVAPFHETQKTGSWSEAVQTALSTCDLAEEGVNILVSHQFYAGGQECESEQVYVGGIDRIAESVLEPFDYAALGHLHTPQNLPSGKGRYCGTLLKFSASETGRDKTITLLEIGGQKTDPICVHEVPVVPLRDFVCLKGSLSTLLSLEFAGQQNRENYIYALVEDEMEGIDVHSRLGALYPNLLGIRYCSTRNRPFEQTAAEGAVRQDPAEIFETFYELQNGTFLDAEMKQILEKTWEECYDAD